MRIKAIMFDSGRVLNRPRSGHWFIPPMFFNHVDQALFRSFQREVVERAFRTAHKYLDAHPFILSEEEEYSHFIRFYTIFSEELPALNLNQRHIEELAYDTVYNESKFEFYEDVFKVIPELYEKYKLGIVSDTWPSLERVFHNMGLRKYFSAFVMSSMLGVTKPHEFMFQTALKELNVEPGESLFIDDNIKNLDGAAKLGFITVWMIRNKQDAMSHPEHYVISELVEINQLLC